MSPLFAALPPADLPTNAYVPPTAVHSGAPLTAARHLAAARDGSHTVRSGDTVYDIAAGYGVSAEAIVRANSLSDGGRWIMPGQTLRIPGSGFSSTTPSPAAQGSSSSSRPSGGSVTVRAGDTLSHIAVRHGVSVSALVSANSISNSRLIHPGQVLTLPGGASSSGSSRSTSSGDASSSGASRTLDRPYDESTIGNLKSGESVPDTFLHYRYSDGIARSAAANREYLAGVSVPDRAEIRRMITDAAERHGVDPALVLAVAYQESGWNHSAVSPANAIGAMQVIPSSGEWASSLIGRELNLLDPQDNVTAGVVIMRALLRSADSTDQAIGGYYQGLASVREHGLFDDTRQYVRNIKHFMQTL